MAEAASTGMEKAEMRKLLVATKEKPVNCAIGVGKDQAIGLLTMDKMKGPKILEKQLMLALPDAKNTRFGTAQVDWDNDPKLVKLYLNKPITGMAKRLVKTLKGTGFSKVQIMMDDGTPVEGAADEEEDAAAASAAPAGAPPPPPPPPPEKEAAAGPDAAELTRRLAALAPRIPAAAGDNPERRAELLKMASMGNVNIKTNNLTYAATYIEQLARALDAAPPAAPAPPPPPPPAPEAAAAKPDAAALGKQLAALIPRVAGITDPAQKAKLAKLATDANVNLKTNNLTYAATYIAQLAAGLDGGTAPAPGATAGGAFETQAKLWADTRASVEAELGRLRTAILDAYKGQPFAGEIAAKFEQRTAPVLSRLDLRLAETLGAAAKADAAKRPDLLGEAKSLVEGYRAYTTDPVLIDLDDNPFAKLTIAARVGAALDGVAKALQ